MDDLTSPIDAKRRELLDRAAHLAGMVIAASLGFRRTAAAAKAAKSDFMYQDHPHNGDGCSDCKFFTAADANGDVGRCAIVEGSVRRDGWCVAFARRIAR